MIVLLSPAKTLDFDNDPSFADPELIDSVRDPDFLDQTEQLAEILKPMTPPRLAETLNVSAKLAELNHRRFQDFEVPLPAADCRPAAYAFRGDVYRGLNVDRWTAAQTRYANDHLRILSGFYGVLRPLDRMLPYRLEMGTRLTSDLTPSGLPTFWRSRVTESIAESIAATGSKFVLNLASKEYFAAVDADRLGVPVVTPAFKQRRDGKLRHITLFAKVARGSMAAWVIKTKAKTTRKLQKFDCDGYRYDSDHSTATEPVYWRDDVPTADR